jgi:hypothetical protein
VIQDLLYLQAGNTSVTSQVLGIALVRGGEVVDVPREPADWPYQTVTDALKDGWRVIKFPELALLLDESRNYALGCEFVLERLREDTTAS